MDLDRSALANGIDRLVGLTLEIHLVDIASEDAGDVRNHVSLVWTQFRTFTDDRHIEIDQSPSRGTDMLNRRFEEITGITTGIDGIIVREELADVLGSDGSEQ